MKTDRSQALSLTICAALYALLLAANFLTPKVADDFSYHFSFASGERITGFFQIFPSMLAHASNMNGRLTAHFLVQLFEVLPKWIFNVVNAGMFTGQLLLITHIAGMGAPRPGGRLDRPLLLLAVFGSIWVFQPAFGQVNLWLDGAGNYLWAAVFALLYLLPYIREYLAGARLRSRALRIAFPLLAFFAGAYSENASAAALFMAAVLLLLTGLGRRKLPDWPGLAALATAACGYLSIFLAPAQWSKKGAVMDIVVLRANFMNALEMFRRLEPLLAGFVVLLTLALLLRADRRRVLLALTFLGGALVGNFIMFAAGYYPERCASASVVLLTAGAAILLREVLGGRCRAAAACLAAVLLLATSYHVVAAFDDIVTTGAAIRANEEAVIASREAGDLDVELPMVWPRTKYSAVWGLRYLATDTAETWPNVAMAKYYGVDSIIGT